MKAGHALSKEKITSLVFTGHFIKAAIARGIANKAMPSTGIFRNLLLLWSRRRREMAVGDRRWGSRPYRADRALGARPRSATRAFSPEGDGGGGVALMGQSLGIVAIDRASGGAGTNARVLSPSIQPLAPEALLRTSGPLRPSNDARWGNPEVDRTQK